MFKKMSKNKKVFLPMLLAFMMVFSMVGVYADTPETEPAAEAGTEATVAEQEPEAAEEPTENEVSALDVSQDEFQIEVTVSANENFRLPTSGPTGGYNKSYSWNIDWGDESGVEHKTQADSPNVASTYGILHNYIDEGTYTITISPNGSTEAWLASFGFGPYANLASQLSITKVITPIKPNMTRTDAQMTGTPPDDEWRYTFQYCHNLTMGDDFTFDQAAWAGITTVGDYFASDMFLDCGGNVDYVFSMNQIFNLPQNLTTVGEGFAYGMFRQNWSNNFTMSPVFNIPQGITTAGGYFASYMFSGCSGDKFTMNEVFNLPQGITATDEYFAAYLFASCRGEVFNMNDVFNLPQGLKTAGDFFALSLFDSCNGNSFTMNENFNLPQGVTTVGEYFGQAMFYYAGGSSFYINDVFKFPKLDEANLSQWGVFGIMFFNHHYGWRDNPPLQTRTIASIINGNETPELKYTFGNGPEDTPADNDNIAIFSDWYYHPGNWGCGGYVGSTVAEANSYTVSVSNVQTSAAAIIAAAGVKAHSLGKDSANITFVGTITSDTNNIPKVPGKYNVKFTATADNYFAFGEDDVTITVTVVADVTYDVAYHSTGHTAGAAPSATNHITGTNATILAKGTLARDGYTFAGWSKDVAAATVHYVPGDSITAISANVDLYAVWTKNATPPSNPPVVDPGTGDDDVTPEIPPTTPTTPTEVVQESTEPEESAPQSTLSQEIRDTLSLADQAKIEAQTGNLARDLLDGNVPLGNFGAKGVWSLLNLILALISFVSLIFVIIGIVRKREYQHVAKLLQIASAGMAIITVAAWVILDKLHMPTAWIDQYTATIGALFVVTAIVTIVFNLTKKNARIAEAELDA